MFEKRKRRNRARMARYFLNHDGWQYVIDIIRDTDIRFGSVYPLLETMEDNTWVEATWSGLPGQTYRRRVYRLTPAGAHQMRRWVEEEIP